MLHQCQALRVRYREQSHPFGKAKRTGNNDEKTTDQKDHVTRHHQWPTALLLNFEARCGQLNRSWSFHGSIACS